jgi:hypothetical protein
VVSQDEEWASSSATSIGTEENSLGVLKARSRALIYMRVAKQGQRTFYKYKEVGVANESSLYGKGDGD